jgi:SAM-dependent methyltransferase
LNAREVIGLDRSAEPLRVAKQRHASTVFWRTVAGADLAPDGIDIAYTSGVFQHIGPEMRQAKLTKIFSRLKPSGLLALFENNPWNPGSQWGISRIEFDRDAKCLYPMETQDRFLIAGFGNLQKRGMFYFSKMLGFIRLLGKILSLATLGAQYEVLA